MSLYRVQDGATPINHVAGKGKGIWQIVADKRDELYLTIALSAIVLVISVAGIGQYYNQQKEKAEEAKEVAEKELSRLHAKIEEERKQKRLIEEQKIILESVKNKMQTSNILNLSESDVSIVLRERNRAARESREKPYLELKRLVEDFQDQKSDRLGYLKSLKLSSSYPHQYVVFLTPFSLCMTEIEKMIDELREVDYGRMEEGKKWRHPYNGVSYQASWLLKDMTETGMEILTMACGYYPLDFMVISRELVDEELLRDILE